MSQLKHPFLAELTSGYNTGLIQQFLPRINSTARYESISADDFPKNCDQIDGAFFVKYMHIEQESMASWGLEACMPGNMTKTPWRPTRDRQDFSEELFLNVTLTGENVELVFDMEMENLAALGYPANMYYKVTLNTTAGYFELPNYTNGGVAGPLLEKDPNGICGNSCVSEGDIYNHGKDPKSRRDGNIINNDDSSLPLEEVYNKGPLLTIAMALFGEGSFIQDRLAHPQAYASPYADSRHIGPCLSLAPMGFLLSNENGYEAAGNPICIRNTDGGANSSLLDEEIVRWIQYFGYDEERLSNAFTAAAFLANQAWMERNVQPSYRSLTILFDMGHDTQVLMLSLQGLILVSILLGLYILILILLAFYAAFVPRWTFTLDSFAMMRIGAAVADKVPLLLSSDTDKIDVLDDIPGYIGDQSEESCYIGKLGLGGTRPLGARQNKVFESYGEP